MITKAVTYTGLDGEAVTETLHFNLTQAEILDIDMSLEGGFEKTIKDAAATDDKKTIINMFRTIIKAAYGVREGSKFKKSAEISEDFTHTEAYSALLVELFTDPEVASSFFNSLVPKVSTLNPPPKG